MQAIADRSDSFELAPVHYFPDQNPSPPRCRQQYSENLQSRVTHSWWSLTPVRLFALLSRSYDCVTDFVHESASLAELVAGTPFPYIVKEVR